MTIKGNAGAAGQRLHWLDNLRTIAILLVVLYHVGGVYEAAGLWSWFWIVADPATITWVGIVGIMFDIMVMPIIFFLSGYLAPASLESKTGWQFVKGKVRRLMLPWVIAVFTLIPLYKVIYLYSRGLPQQHWSTYFHITNPNSQNWLWFLPVLFLFNMFYLLLNKTNIRLSNLSLKGAVLAAFVVGLAYSYFSGGILGFRSWTLTPLIDFENERVLIYFLAFLLGAFCFRHKLFAAKAERSTLYLVASSVAWLPVTGHIFVRLWPYFVANFAVTPAYRLAWWVSFHLSAVCMVYLLVESFRLYVDRSSRTWDVLNRNSFGVYIIHVIMIGIFGTLLLNTGLPAVVKYLLLIVSTYLGSNLVTSGYRALLQTVRADRARSTS